MVVQLHELRPLPSAQEQAEAQRQLELRQQRQLAMSDTRRAHVLDAARRVFAARGVEGASIREIAREAGYTAGALYSYFDSKEAICAALVAESLDRLQAEVQAARAPKGQPAKALVAKAQAWFGFYAQNPRDLDLGFLLVNGLSPELDRALNERLLQALSPCEQAFEDMGLSPDAAARENAALFAQGMGLLLLQHTGRIRLFGQAAPALFAQYVDRLVERFDPAIASGAVKQRDLFAE
ncbi:MAG: TetR/AcrR family transcriptional regulator [Hydrogenophaga sp.]|uniref:TetR/AcrR family transcriptional regulator n=1 Tax=Hydrogenophaga crocea TaxID=2716225 RepID=A0A6G8IGN0_9BURK|nr:TetR/AcrR family transcriptional regulator [Hydrogenophaga sp.]QIM52218.1 TetR/AcrR family transcriptional regulator [Hydrogenophaga crocea]